jgi:predicted RNase H-like nuclease (RuvC/YqgF family)
MARGKTITNSGIVGDYEEMLNFTNHLNKLIKELLQSRDSAYASLKKMNEVGFKDNIFEDFENKFKKNAEYIDELKSELDASIDYYNRVADLTKIYLDEKF